MLIADDEAHIRAVMAGIVRALGGEVVAEAGDGEEAVQLFERTHPDVVILDINMPRLTGDQALGRMLKSDPHVLGVMMTAQDSITAVRDCLDLGARNYILKSNRAEEILRLLGAVWPEYTAEVSARMAQ